ncbi:MAG: UDP-N-acetylmuramate dehydrogenase [Alphaproteobacteria bacterium]|nr:UDP-N-acetylmuramate dehydrogenase [Alphaproteobacteria bacterium]
MMAAERNVGLMERLPVARGRIAADVPIHKYTWFRVGGAAEVLFEPADLDDLATFLAGLERDIPVTVIGVASNLLVRDGGVAGVVIRLGRRFADIRVEGDQIAAGAGATDIEVARACRDAGLAGLEFLSGIPGTIGGALRMNAGAYGREIAEVVVSAEALDRKGALQALTPADLGFGYRSCAIDPDWVFVACRLAGTLGDPSAIAARMREIAEARAESQPIRMRTGGSTFKNPPGHTAWRLIEEAGCRGLAVGGAAVSDQHCNFLINTGGATAADFEALGEEVRRRVREHCDIDLEWEIQRIGEPLAPGGGQ